MSGFCDHDGEACQCGMEIIVPLRADRDRLREALRWIANVAEDEVEARREARAALEGK